MPSCLRETDTITPQLVPLLECYVHLRDALRSEVFVVYVLSDLLHVLHVRRDEHGPQLHEVAVSRVFN